MGRPLEIAMPALLQLVKDAGFRDYMHLQREMGVSEATLYMRVRQKHSRLRKWLALADAAGMTLEELLEIAELPDGERQDVLTAALREQGLRSLRQWAAKAGTSHATVGRMYSGDMRKMSLRVEIMLAEALQVDLKTLGSALLKPAS